MDVYSFAVICYETLSRKLLFSDLVKHRFDETKVREAVLRGERPQLVDEYPLENPPEQVKKKKKKKKLPFSFSLFPPVYETFH